MSIGSWQDEEEEVTPDRVACRTCGRWVDSWVEVKALNDGDSPFICTGDDNCFENQLVVCGVGPCQEVAVGSITKGRYSVPVCEQHASVPFANGGAK